MNKIIAFSVKHPVSVLMMLASVLVWSFIALKLIPLDFLPEIEDRFLLVSAEYENLSAIQMKKLVTVPLEDCVASIKGIKNISSVTRDCLSLIKIELHWGNDIELALSECNQLLDQCYETLPADCSKPNVRIFNPYDSENIRLAVISKEQNLEKVRYLAVNEFKQKFQRLKGAASVNVYGGETAEIQIEADKEKIESFGLNLEALAQIVVNSNFEYPGGTITDGSDVFSFKTDGTVKNIEDFAQIPLFALNGASLKLGDVAEVKKGIEEKKSFFMYNGRECICLEINKKNDASPIALSIEVKMLLAELKSFYGADFEFSIISDSSEQLKESFIQLLASLFTGLVITVFILLLFFKQLKFAFLTAFVIPLSILFSILCLKVCGKSLNLISISGIAIGLGMVVDPVTVLIENFLFNLKNCSKGDSLNIESLVLKSTEQVSLSSVGSSLTTIVVFIPFFFLPALTGKLFVDLAIAVISSIGFSCLLSLSYAPCVLVLLFRGKSSQEILQKESLNISFIEEKYSNFLAALIKKPSVAVYSLIFVIIAGCIFAKSLKFEMMPSIYSKNICAEIFFDESSSHELLEKNARYLNSLLKNNKNIISFSIEGGLEKNDYEKLIQSEIRSERLLVNCLVKNVKEAQEFFRELFENSGLKVNVKGEKNLLEKILETNADSVLICAETDELLKEKLSQLKINDFSPDSVITEKVFEVDRSLCAKFNISASMVALTAKSILEGENSGYFYKDGEKIKIRIKYPPASVSSIPDLLSFLTFGAENAIPLAGLGEVSTKSVENVFYRFNRLEAKKVFLQENLQNEKYVLNPDAENLIELKHNTVVLLFIVILLLYCVMGAQFESFTIPLFMLLALPPAFSGAFLFLFVFCQILNINSVIALVVLFGTSVNSAIILWESIKEEKLLSSQNLCLRCKQKLRSILITNLTSALALLPFAIDPLHKNSQSSMAIAICGGLIFSFVIVLFVVPVILFKFSSKKDCL